MMAPVPLGHVPVTAHLIPRASPDVQVALVVGVHRVVLLIREARVVRVPCMRFDMR